MEFKPDFSLILAIYLALILFGIGFNLLVAGMEKRGYLEGFTSLAVVVGTLVTLGGLAVIWWPAAVLALGAFAASGLPMVAGSIWRYIQRRAQVQKVLIAEIKNNPDLGIPLKNEEIEE